MCYNIVKRTEKEINFTFEASINIRHIFGIIDYYLL